MMRIAVVSDIHGNLTALEAVLADLRETSPDLVLHGGDLADGGARPAEVVDLVRELGWQGVGGNVDEMLWNPASLEEFASHIPSMQSLFRAVGDIAASTREALGEDRIAWLRTLPRRQGWGEGSLVHASPDDVWRAPAPEQSNEELEAVYQPLGSALVVYAHIHRPYVRSLADMTIANAGSVGLPYDGDRRAAYLLIQDSVPIIRRVEYDVEREIRAVNASGMPHSGWIAKMLETGTPRLP